MTSTTLTIPKKDVINIKSLLLTLFVINTFIFGLSRLVRGMEAATLLIPALIGFGLGWLLSRSKLKTWQALLLAVLTGLIIIFVRIAGLDTYFISQVKELHLSWPRPEISLIWPVFQDVADSLGLISIRFGEWLVQIILGQPAVDPLMLTFTWSFGVWASAFWASWGLWRYNNPFTALLPTLLIYTASLDFSNKSPNSLLSMIAAGIILMILITHEKFIREWKKNEIQFPYTIKYNTYLLTAGLSIGLTFAAFLIPSISIEKIEDIFNRIRQRRQSEGSEVGSALGLVSENNDPISGEILLDWFVGGLPNKHLMNSGPELSEQLVMTVHIDDPYAPDIQSEDTSRVYLRNLTYQTYTLDGWRNRNLSKEFYLSDQAAIQELPPNQRPINFTVTMAEESELAMAYLPGTLVSTNTDYRVEFRTEDNKDNSNDIFGAMVTSSTYEGQSYMSLYGIEGLRTAGQDYPDWVLKRYLALPDSVPDRVVALANELTATELTPYDRAVALESYLRTFPYTLDLPSPPYNRDIVDYFLFTVQTGYCDYYASSMVVMARSIGLPARLVVGYVADKYDPSLDAYLVTADQAHSWVEIYFPEYGWVEFEPTAGRPTISRPQVNPNTLPEEIERTPEEIITETITQAEYMLYYFVTVILPVMVGLALFIAYMIPTFDLWLLQRKTPTKVATVLYQRLAKFGTSIQLEPSPKDSPTEYAQLLIHKLEQIADQSGNAALLDSSPAQIKWLTMQTVQSLYSPRKPDASDKSRMILAWKRLRWDLQKTRWQIRWDQIQSKFKQFFTRKPKKNSPA